VDSNGGAVIGGYTVTLSLPGAERDPETQAWLRYAERVIAERLYSGPVNHMGNHPMPSDTQTAYADVGNIPTN
jgi:hypothetical protein